MRRAHILTAFLFAAGGAACGPDDSPGEDASVAALDGASGDAGATADGATYEGGGDAGMREKDASGPSRDGGDGDASPTDGEIGDGSHHGGDSDAGAEDAGAEDATPSDSGHDDGGQQTDGGTDPSCHQHTFEFLHRRATQVWVTGSFTSPPWAVTPQAGALALSNLGVGLWRTTLELPRESYEYKFIIDGARWTDDPSNPGTGPDRNSQLTICGGAPGGVCGDLEAFDWRDAIMYYAMVDRFYDGDSSNNRPVDGATGGNARTGPSAQFEGGDLKGVRDRMPYLANLGVTALWLSAPSRAANSRAARWIPPGTGTCTRATTGPGPRRRTSATRYPTIRGPLQRSNLAWAPSLT